jgi:hypothetical protein
MTRENKVVCALIFAMERFLGEHSTTRDFLAREMFEEKPGSGLTIKTL